MTGSTDLDQSESQYKTKFTGDIRRKKKRKIAGTDPTTMTHECKLKLNEINLIRGGSYNLDIKRYRTVAHPHMGVIGSDTTVRTEGSR